MQTSSSEHPLLQVVEGKHHDQPNRIDVRIQEFLDESRLTAVEDTVKCYKQVLTGFMEYAKSTGIVDVHDIRQQLCRNWLMHLLGTKRLKESTLALYRTILSVFIGFLKESRYYLDENPLTNIRRVPTQKTNKRPFTRAEFLKLLSIAPSMKQNYWYYGVMTSYHTGLRLGDVAMLRRDAINWEDETITVKPQKTQRKNTKVVIPIETTEFYPFLKAFIAAPIDPFYHFATEYVCPEMATEVMKYYGSRGVLSTQFKRMCKRAGLEEMSFHKLRDTFASRLMNAGNDAIVVASMTGHTDLNVLREYVHVSTDRKRTTLANSI